MDWSDSSGRDLTSWSNQAITLLEPESSGGHGMLSQEKPLPQGASGSAARLIGGALAMVLVLVVTLTVFLLYRWQQKNQLGTDIDGMDMSPHQKLDPPPDRQSQSAPEDFQGLHLEPGRLQEEDLTLQPPYYDLGVSPIYRPLTGQSVFLPKDQHRVLPEVAAMKEEPESSCLKDSDIHYAELDTSVLELAPGPQTAVSGPGEAVEYATIPLSPPEH